MYVCMYIRGREPRTGIDGASPITNRGGSQRRYQRADSTLILNTSILAATQKNLRINLLLLDVLSVGGVIIDPFTPHLLGFIC